MTIIVQSSNGLPFQVDQKMGSRPVLASAFFRTVLHAYAGLNLAVTCLLIGLIFGLAYWRWRQLWPLFVAHAIMDFYALHRLIQPA
jgi:membrane protease YdiL (CAAX protease family)